MTVRIQQTLVAMIQASSAVVASGAVVIDKVIAAPRFDGDPLGTPTALLNGSPVRSIYVPDAPAVPHPTDSWQGYIDFWVEIHFYAPADDVTGMATIRSALYDALAGKRVIATHGILARVGWVRDGIGPFANQSFPDTDEDFTRYRVTTRFEEEPVNGYDGRS